MLAEGHREVAIEPAGRIHVDGDGKDVGAGLPTIAEEISDGTFDAGLLFIVPVNPQNDVAIELRVHGDPDMLDDARAIDVHDRGGARGEQVNGGANLPTLAQIAGVAVLVPGLADFHDLGLRGFTPFGPSRRGLFRRRRFPR